MSSGGDIHIWKGWKVLVRPSLARPVCTLLLTMVFALLLGVIGFLIGGFDSGTGGGRFSALTEETDRMDTITELAVLVKEDKSNTIPERSSAALNAIFVYKMEDDSNIFTSAALEAIKAWEDERVFSRDGYSEFCTLDTTTGSCSSTAALSLPFLMDDGSGNVKTGASLDAGLQTLSSTYTFFLPSDTSFDSNGTPSSSFTRSLVGFGLPLRERGGDYPVGDNYINEFHDLTDQTEIFGEWISGKTDNGSTDEIFFREGDTFTDSNGHTIRAVHYIPWLSDVEIGTIIDDDVILLNLAYSAVVAVIAVVTGSFFLGAVGVIFINTSVVSAYFLYRVVFGREIFNSLSQMTFFLLLALGADNLFVYASFWEQSETVFKREEYRKRLEWVCQKAGGGVLVTNLTSTAAFAATATSSLPAMASFGYYATSVILMNLVQSMIAFPALLLVWEKYFRHRSRVANFFKKLKGGSTNAVSEAQSAGAEAKAREDAAAVSAPMHVALDEHGCHLHAAMHLRSSIQNKVFSKLAPFIMKWRYVIFGVSACFVAATAYMSTLLTTPDDFSTQMPLGFAIRDFQDLVEDFSASSDADSLEVVLLFPASVSIDRDGFDPNLEADVGEVTFTSDRITSTQDQELLLEACSILESHTDLVLNGSIDCLLRDFEAWGAIQTSPFTYPLAPAEFGPKLREYVRSDGVFYSADVAFDSESNGYEVMSLTLTANTTLPVGAPADSTQSERDAWDEVEDEINSKFSEEGSSLTVSQASQVWVNLSTALELRSSAVNSVLISLGFALVVLLIVTQNPVLSVLSVLAVTTIIVGVLGMLYAFGYNFNIVCSISIAILSGITVDYALHISAGYLESEASSRYGRFRSSITELWVGITAGCATTLLSSLTLFFARFELFSTFGVVIFSAICLAYIMAHSVLSPMLLFAAPVGKYMGHPAGSFQAFWAWVMVKSGKTPPPPSSSSPASPSASLSNIEMEPKA